MVELTVARLGLDTATNAYVVILREKDGRRMLPIWIRHLEAEAISDHLNNVSHPRPLTHDLCRALIVSLGGTVQRVNITRVHESTYYAELHVMHPGGTVHIDARPSDSIAIALRFDAPIYAPEELLTMLPADDDEEDDDEAEDYESPNSMSAAELSAERLKAHLRKLKPEDFGKFSP